MDDGQPQSSSTADAAFQSEDRKILTDPNWGKDPALVARRDALYEKRYGPPKPVSIGEDFHFSDKGSAENPPQDALAEAVHTEAHNTAVLDHLQTTYGSPEAVAQVQAGAGEMVQQLFPDDAARAHGLELADRIAQMGPKAEAAIIAMLYQLHTKGGP